MTAEGQWGGGCKFIQSDLFSQVIRRIDHPVQAVARSGTVWIDATPVPSLNASTPASLQ